MMDENAVSIPLLVLKYLISAKQDDAAKSFIKNEPSLKFYIQYLLSARSGSWQQQQRDGDIDIDMNYIRRCQSKSFEVSLGQLLDDYNCCKLEVHEILNTLTSLCGGVPSESAVHPMDSTISHLKRIHALIKDYLKVKIKDPSAGTGGWSLVPFRPASASTTPESVPVAAVAEPVFAVPAPPNSTALVPFPSTSSFHNNNGGTDNDPEKVEQVQKRFFESVLNDKRLQQKIASKINKERSSVVTSKNEEAVVQKVTSQTLEDIDQFLDNLLSSETEDFSTPSLAPEEDTLGSIVFSDSQSQYMIESTRLSNDHCNLNIWDSFITPTKLTPFKDFAGASLNTPHKAICDVPTNFAQPPTISQEAIQSAVPPPITTPPAPFLPITTPPAPPLPITTPPLPITTLPAPPLPITTSLPILTTTTSTVSTMPIAKSSNIIATTKIKKEKESNSRSKVVNLTIPPTPVQMANGIRLNASNVTGTSTREQKTSGKEDCIILHVPPESLLKNRMSFALIPSTVVPTPRQLKTGPQLRRLLPKSIKSPVKTELKLDNRVPMAKSNDNLALSVTESLPVEPSMSSKSKTLILKRNGKESSGCSKPSICDNILSSMKASSSSNPKICNTLNSSSEVMLSVATVSSSSEKPVANANTIRFSDSITPCRFLTSNKTDIIETERKCHSTPRKKHIRSLNFRTPPQGNVKDSKKVSTLSFSVSPTSSPSPIKGNNESSGGRKRKKPVSQVSHDVAEPTSRKKLRYCDESSSNEVVFNPDPNILSEDDSLVPSCPPTPTPRVRLDTSSTDTSSSGSGELHSSLSSIDSFDGSPFKCAPPTPGRSLPPPKATSAQCPPKTMDNTFGTFLEPCKSKIPNAQPSPTVSPILSISRTKSQVCSETQSRPNASKLNKSMSNAPSKTNNGPALPVSTASTTSSAVSPATMRITNRRKSLTAPEHDTLMTLLEIGQRPSVSATTNNTLKTPNANTKQHSMNGSRNTSSVFGTSPKTSVGSLLKKADLNKFLSSVHKNKK